MKYLKKVFSFIAMTTICSGFVLATSAGKEKEIKKDTLINSDLVSGLTFRSIGPAFTSGRIADFAVNPANHSEFYVAVASGNIWKTTNNGITFDPVFDSYGAYSIGCLSMDPKNPNVVWTGTGENNHQRELGYGDGVYLTLDGGKKWTNMGLKESRQIGMILIDPRNSNVVYVAAEGSAWGPGGDRGLYKTTDRGKTWIKILNISENTGVNNIMCDPRNPDILYATSEQRRRHVNTKIGGGPETAVYKSENAGQTWRKLESGLPKEDMGGMGMAISPQNPDVLYLIIEAANNAGGFFRSVDRGESWTKMSSYASSGQYFNEIYCDPITFDKVYSMETFSKCTHDGGQTWTNINVTDRHVDDHVMWIDPTDNNHQMIGSDGGIYITYDNEANWYHVSNLPVNQFYRVTVDNSEPFYHVYGGTQDNATLGGPSQNTSEFGVTSGEWEVTVFGDGFWCQVDPKDPNIVYSEAQYGNVVRYDRKSGERLDIKPQPRKNELTYKWNWNSPIIISPHKNTRIYMAANKVFRSDDRGDSWQVISDDLTTQLDRNTWPVMGKYWSSDAVAKDVSTSLYGTIVSLDESPVKEDLLYAGTDDGLIQVTPDAGKHWTKIESFSGVPKNTYVSDIFASRFDENVVFASFDNTKRDDFTPYLLKSSDKGNTWISIASNLPKNGAVHTIEQDFINPDLLFAGTEFGVFFSIDGGKSWVQFKSGLPTIPVRDIAIQERENDLAIATFGRGFYILDNYSSLRQMTEEMAKEPAHLFPVKDALLFMKTDKIYGQGATYYGAKNPPFGATFDFYLKEVPKTKKELRHDQEKALFKDGKPIPQISLKDEEAEEREIPPYLLVTICDSKGSIIRTFAQKPQKGIQRMTWDLKYSSPEPLKKTDKFDPFTKNEGGVFVMPGSYSVEITMVSQEKQTQMAKPVSFMVKPLNNTTLPAENREQMVAFQEQVSDYAKKIISSISLLNDLKTEVSTMKQTAINLPYAQDSLIPELNKVENQLNDIEFQFKGVQPKASFEEIPPAHLPIYERLNTIIYAQLTSTSGITKTSGMSFNILKDEYPPVLNRLIQITDIQIIGLRQLMNRLNAAYTPYRIPKLK